MRRNSFTRTCSYYILPTPGLLSWSNSVVFFSMSRGPILVACHRWSIFSRIDQNRRKSLRDETYHANYVGFQDIDRVRNGIHERKPHSLLQQPAMNDIHVVQEGSICLRLFASCLRLRTGMGTSTHWLKLRFPRRPSYTPIQLSFHQAETVMSRC